jgi:hypothetical protein
VLSSTTGHVYQYFQPFGASYKGVVNVALGDVTGNGIPDILVSTRSTMNGQVLVFDGAAAIEGGVNFNNSSTWDNGSGSILPDDESSPLLATLTPFAGYTGGLTVAAGEVTSTQFSDIIVGTVAGTEARVVLFKYTGHGTTSMIGSPIVPFGTTFKGGVSLAAGDVTGNGLAQIVVGSASQESYVKIYGYNSSNNSFTQLDSKVLDPFGVLTVGVQVSVIDVAGSNVDDIAVSILENGTDLLDIINDLGVVVHHYNLGSGVSASAISIVDVNENDNDLLVISQISASVSKKTEFVNPVTGGLATAPTDFPVLVGGISLAGS